MWVKGLLSIIVFINVLSNAFSSPATPFQLDEYLHGSFSDRGWNGTWISDSEILYEDNLKNIYKFNVTKKTSKLFLDRSIFNGYGGSSISFSKDFKYGLLRYNEIAVFRHSRTAQYTVYDIENKRYYDVHNKTHLQIAQWAPKGSALVYVFENNIYYVSNATNSTRPRQITYDGIPGVIYNGVPDWVYEEEVLGSGSALWFSPDGENLAFAHFNDTKVQEFHYFMYGESNNQYPTVVSLKYPKVGTRNPTVAVKLVNLKNSTSNVTELDIILDGIVSKDHVLQDITWANETHLVGVSLNRVQNVAAIVQCNVQSHGCRKIYAHNETKGWIELASPIFNNNGTKFLLLTSEPEGNDSYKHLSLTESAFSDRKRLTSGKRVVSGVYGWDQVRNLVYYVGSVEGQQGQQQVYVVNLTSNTDRCLTCDFSTSEGPCTVASAAFSKEFSHFTRVCSGPGPRTVQVQNLQSLEYFTWENNTELRNRLLQKLKPVIKTIKVPLSSGFTAHVRMLLPPGFDTNSDVKYPLIVDVYGGPNSNQISESYSTGVENYFVTNRKYIYAFIDARGSGKNGDNNMFQIYRRMGTVEIADTIEVTRYLQQNHRFIDSNRTGVWGWSYGGFATLHILAQDTNNVFKFGLAVAPVTNFILYDSIYTERYMGLNTNEDNEKGYNDTDVSRAVEAFRNKTFYLIHGNADDNVHYQQSMLFSKALERADVMFFQQSYPDENHNLGSVRPHLYHTIDKFFDHGIRSVRKGNIWKLKKSKEWF